MACLRAPYADASMPRLKRASTLLIVLWALASCRDPSLHGSTGLLEFRPATLDFGDVYLGASSDRGAELINSGRSALPVTWDAVDAPFEVVSAPDTSPSGGVTVTLRFRPDVEGVAAATLLGHSGDTAVSLALRGAGAKPPPCAQPVACHQVDFDLSNGTCVDSPLPDGTACDPHSVCVDTASCQAGRCVGAQKSCDDADACTLDVCDPARGCEHLAAVACPGDGRCQVGACDPSVGCVLTPAPDGTYCGPTRTCDVADVCIAGACVQRDPPDGFVCAPASPCQGQGRCVGSVCERPPPSPLQESWAFDALAQDGGTDLLHDLVLDPAGEVSLMGFFAVPISRANTPAATRLSSAARRCILWNTRLVCADYPYNNGSGKVSSLDPANGTTLWTFDLVTARPDWVQLASPGRLFMARLASLGGDRLAALFEAYPAGQAADTLCRLYFLVVLDASGAMVAATRVQDPMLDLCNHPHPYGVAADVAGNLTLSFSGSLPGTAPLVPQWPTLLTSYSRDGVFRWKRTEQIFGGELAVALGNVYPENSGIAFGANDGAVQWWLNPQPTGVFGRPVVTLERLLPSPKVGASTLWSFSTSANLAYGYSTPPGASFASDQLRLASWLRKEGEPPESVALMFVARGGQPWLTAVSTQFANEEWACPLAGTFRTAPQLFEVAQGSMALMEGSNACGNCDPAFAQSQAAFHTYALPGVGLPVAPWTGTWGGPGHDHREDPVGAYSSGPSQ
jgi:hypothetical protein